MQVPDGWEVKPLKDILTIQYGKDQKEVESENGKYPILGSGGVIGYTNHFLYDKPSVLIGRKGTINNPQYMETPFWTVDTLFYSHIKNKNIPKWVYYVFQSINWDSYNEASGVPSLSTANINRIEVLNPTIKEQEKIAKILSTLDRAIESTNRLIEKEKNIKIGLMNELLINGIDQNGQIRTKATHTYKPSELGLIPDEWEVVSLGEITKIVGGGTPSRDIEEYWKNGTIPWVTVKDLHDGLLIKESEEYITKKGLQSSATNLIEANNIITSTRMGIGRFYINEIDVTINQDMKALFVKDNIDKQFLLWSLLHFGKKLEVLGTGTTVKGILLDDLKSLKLVFPLLTEQKQIAKILTTQDKKIQTEETNLAKLKELKKGLMNDLLSGRVRVKCL